MPSLYFHTEPLINNISDRQLKKHNLHRWQFIYTPEFMDYVDKKDDNKIKIPIYVGESKQLVLEGMRIWKRRCIPEFGRHIDELICLTDNGQAWKFDGASLLETIGVKKHQYLAAVAHAYMSTCDNGTNGPCKQVWRAAAKEKSPPYTDVIRSTCVLLEASQAQSKSYIIDCWSRNFLLDIEEDEIDDNRMRQMFHATTPKWVEFHNHCKSDYYDFIQKKGDWLHLRNKYTAGVKNTGPNGPAYDGYEHLASNVRI